MKFLFLTAVFFLLIISCKAQTEDIAESQNDSTSNPKPQTKIIVNKEYDENGNLIAAINCTSYSI